MGVKDIVAGLAGAGILVIFVSVMALPLNRINPGSGARQLLKWSCPFAQKAISCDLKREIISSMPNNTQICLWDVHTAHTPDRISAILAPTKFHWNRSCAVSMPRLFSVTTGPDDEGACINATYCIFITMEPPAVDPVTYERISAKIGAYSLVLSLGDQQHLNGSNVVQWAVGSTWIPFDQWSLYPKNKLCSIIVSSKNKTVGHMLRHNVVSLINDRNISCDIVGAGYKPLKNKKDGLADYMFSVVIENSISGKYMTEKIIDALACGTVPIYWGTSFAQVVFKDAVIPWNTTAQLAEVLTSLSAEKYSMMQAHVIEAQKRAREFASPEQGLWQNVFGCAFQWHANHECVTSDNRS